MVFVSGHAIGMAVSFGSHSTFAMAQKWSSHRAHTPFDNYGCNIHHNLFVWFPLDAQSGFRVSVKLTYSINTTIFFNSLDKIALFWKTIYTNSPMRAQPYLIGLLLGFFLECPRKKAPSKWFVLLAWVISLGLMAFVLFGLMLSHTEAIRDVTWAAALYGSTHRLVWSLGLAWIIYACHKGFGGLKSFLISFLA